MSPRARLAITKTEIANSLVTVLDVEDVPAVRLESQLDVLGEGHGGVTVDGDFYRQTRNAQIALILDPLLSS